MKAAYILFWTSLAVLFYCYIGYGLLVFLWNGLRGKRKKAAQQTNEVLPVTLVVAAFNEAAVLPAKIRNSLAIRYPPGQLTILFIIDGSTDGSAELLKNFPGIICMQQEGRKGKYAAIKRAMREVKTPIVIFSDANALLNPECVERIIGHYHDPNVEEWPAKRKSGAIIPHR